MRTSKQNRIESLDWLRGLMAISILFYHANNWLFHQQDTKTVLVRLGIYAVSIFFVLSGLSMSIAYSNKINSLKDHVDFFIRRLFRISPLLLVICILTLIPAYMEGLMNVGKLRFLLNVTGLFGIFDYSNYISYGSWSIGNEIVYYLFTPFFLNIYVKNKKIGNLFFLISIIISLYFSQFLLNPEEKLASQWKTYINPFNNLSLYLGGIFIYYNFKDIKFKKKHIIIALIVSILAFSLYPVSGDRINIVTGFPRAYFITLSILLVLIFYKINFSINKIVEKQLMIFGMATYGIYLIHPIVYNLSNYFFKLNEILNPYIYIIFIFIMSTLLALFSYYKYESPISKIGKKISKKINSLY